MGEGDTSANTLYWRDEWSEEVIMSGRIVATMSVLVLSLSACGQSNNPGVSSIIPAGDGAGPAGSGDTSTTNQTGSKSPAPCGDGLCVVPETVATCPQDCTSDPTGNGGGKGGGKGGKGGKGDNKGGTTGSKATVSQCLNEKCSKEMTACTEDKDCAALRTCLQGCSGDATCKEKCRKDATAQANGMQKALTQCGIQQACLGQGKGSNAGNKGGKAGNQGDGPDGSDGG